jgi:hypothetical protein
MSYDYKILDRARRGLTARYEQARELTHSINASRQVLLHPETRREVEPGGVTAMFLKSLDAMGSGVFHGAIAALNRVLQGDGRAIAEPSPGFYILTDPQKTGSGDQETYASLHLKSDGGVDFIPTTVGAESGFWDPGTFHATVTTVRVVPLGFSHDWNDCVFRSEREDRMVPGLTQGLLRVGPRLREGIIEDTYALSEDPAQQRNAQQIAPIEGRLSTFRDNLV